MMINALSLGISSCTNAEYADLPHVLLVLDQFPKTLGGGERIVLKIAALLPQYGYRASILTFSVHPESTALNFRQFLRQQKIKIVQTFFESSDLWAGFLTRTLSNSKLVWSRRDMGILR